MKRKIITLFIFMMALLATGCGKNEDNSEEVGVSDEIVNTYPMTLTDQAGREVLIEKEPESIVSGYYISTSLLIALD